MNQRDLPQKPRKGDQRKSPMPLSKNEILNRAVHALDKDIRRAEYAHINDSTSYIRLSIAQYRLALLIVSLIFILSIFSVFEPGAVSTLDKLLPMATFVLGYFFKAQESSY